MLSPNDSEMFEFNSIIQLRTNINPAATHQSSQSPEHKLIHQ